MARARDYREHLDEVIAAGPDRVAESVDLHAEVTSANMCDQCGKWATLDTDANGWLRTRCENHKDQK